MKAERVQFWQRVLDTGRSLVSRIYDFFTWLEAGAGAIAQIVRDFLDLRKS